MKTKPKKIKRVYGFGVLTTEGLVKQMWGTKKAAEDYIDWLDNISIYGSKIIRVEIRPVKKARKK